MNNQEEKVQTIRRRNVHQALYDLAQQLFENGQWTKPGNKCSNPTIELHGGIAITYDKPAEFATFEPLVDPNPMARWTSHLEWLGRMHSADGNRPLRVAADTIKAGRCAAILIEGLGTLHLVRSADSELEGMLASASIEAYSDVPIAAARCSMLMQFVAHATGSTLGPLTHVAVEVFQELTGDEDSDPTTYLAKKIAGAHPGSQCPYEGDKCTPFELCSIKPNPWLRELDAYMARGCEATYQDPFFLHVVDPIVDAYAQVGGCNDPHRWLRASNRVQKCLATDLRLWFGDWLHRKEAEQDG